MVINKFLLKNLILIFSLTIYAQKNDNLNDYTFVKLKDLIKKEQNDQQKLFYSKLFLQKAKKENNKEFIIEAYIKLSQSSITLNDGIEYLDSLSKYNRKNNYLSVAAYYFYKGWLYSRYREEDKAIDNFVKSLKFVDKIKEQKLYYKIKLNIVIIKSGQQDYSDAIRDYKVCEKYFKKIDSTGQYYLCSIYGLAENYIRIGDVPKADFYTKKGLSITRQIKNNELINRFLCCDGMNDYAKKNYTSSIVKLKSTLPILNNLSKDFLNYAINCATIGKSYSKLNDNKNAILYFKKVDSIFQKSKVFFPENIDVYYQLIKYYENNRDVKQQLYYTTQLIKADNYVNTKYKYLTNKIHKDYDIAELEESKSNLIQQLEYNNVYLNIGLIILFAFVAFILLYFKKYKSKQALYIEQLKQKNEEFISKQKEIFEKKSREEFLLEYNINKPSSIEIPERVRDEVLKKLKKFEKEMGFTNKKCTLENLSKQLKTNSSYLSRIINDEMECNFSTYLNNLRIDHAIYLLKTNKKIKKLTIASISEIVGYSNVKPFTTAFKERYSILPSAYIKDFINNKL